MSMMKQIKQNIIKSHMFNVITAHLHYDKRRKELKKLMGKEINKYFNMPIEPEAELLSNYVWVCWWQGEKAMSPIVKECYKRICTYNSDKMIVLITDENFKEYVSFPDYILEKYHKGIITRTHFSDLLRTELLCKYGGVWMDITILIHSGIPKEFYEYSIYTGRLIHNIYDYNVSHSRWSSFFWVSRYPNNVLFQYLSEFWRIYWKKHDELIEYFLIDYAIDFGYRNIPAVKYELDAVPVNSCGDDLWCLLKILADNFDINILNSIEEKNWMQKLSYKGENKIQEKSKNPENSIYKKLFLDNKMEC